MQQNGVSTRQTIAMTPSAREVVAPWWFWVPAYGVP